jgi:alpha-galactosidase
MGDGLLEHNRAYLQWLDSIFEKYPDLTIENCGSGGLRMDYAMLSRHSIQSSSDQTDYIKNAAIAASSVTAVNPEQCAIWSYPLSGSDKEETAMNMVNAMMLRIHQSGHLAQLPKEQFDLVKEGIAAYKKIRMDIKQGVPFWPIGIPQFHDSWFAFGLDCNNCAYIAVWRILGEPILNVPMRESLWKYSKITPIYPEFANDNAVINENHTISFSLENIKSARIFKLEV